MLTAMGAGSGDPRVSPAGDGMNRTRRCVTTASRAAQEPGRSQPANRPAVRRTSSHLVDPAQATLFDMRRDWTCLTVGELDQLPALTPGAEALLDKFRQHAQEHGWNAASQNTGARTLRILLAAVGADAPIHDADIRALPGRRSTTIRRVLQFLTAEGGHRRPAPPWQRRRTRRSAAHLNASRRHRRGTTLLGTGPARPGPPAASAVPVDHDPFLSQLPVPNAGQLGRPRRQPARDHQAGHPRGPQEPATRDSPQSPVGPHSLFRALKQEKLIFRDPTRGISRP